ncbi:hypothetical protein EsH8_VII_000728 [Colletotrichum jinshuiense]
MNLGNVRYAHMEHFQRLEEDVANLILRHGFLDPDDLPFVTPGEVENAAALALQMADPDEQLAIAMRRSTIRDRRSPAPRRPDNRDPGPAAYINWQERNRLLADSAATSAAASANSSENGEGEERECPETRYWRRDRRAHRQRPREGARAWPIFEIHAEDPLCSHHLPTSWEVENMLNRPQPPQCIFCRSRDQAVYFRCRTCGIVACSMHNTIRFGLTWGQALRALEELQNRVWLEVPETRGGWFRQAFGLR